ncbi:NAD kinase [Actinidia chinensis var. chinensis]|uniref:NAD kinase n=1 Tax=Actinidia chinensis var. chinensis TaxID=1590841 RepID=A0A2R6QIF4_ACTCC|nr:NAD kinase [Actinidia chinensis var. chinensis]
MPLIICVQQPYRSVHHQQLVAQSHCHVLNRFRSWFSLGGLSSPLLWFLCRRYLEASYPFGTLLSMHNLLQPTAAYYSLLQPSYSLLELPAASWSFLYQELPTAS